MKFRWHTILWALIVLVACLFLLAHPVGAVA